MEVSIENNMLEAVEKGDLRLVSQLLSKGANPNKTVSNGRTCLCEAALRGFTQIAKKLIAGSHSDRKMNDGKQNYCYSFTRYKRIEATIDPLERELGNLSLYTKYRNNKRMSESCCHDFNNRSKVVDTGYYKISHGNGPSGDDSKVAGSAAPLTPMSPQTDLEWDEDIVKVAASTKEDDLVVDMYMWYASILESTGAAVVAASDFTCGIDQEDAFGRSPLSYAADESHVDIVKALIKAGCKLDTPGSATGWTVLHASCATNRIEVIKVLLAAGSNVNISTPTKTTAMHMAACHNLEMTTVIADYGGSLDARDEKDRTPLYLAAAQGHADIVRFLISRQANINIEDINGHTPLCAAVAYQHVDTAEELLKAGARITHYQCLLHAAISDQMLDMTMLLANYACGINVHTGFGDTPLLVAFTTDNPLPYASLLLQKGANVNACNSISGLNALHVAVSFGDDSLEFEAIINMLLNFNIDINKLSFSRETALNKAIKTHKALIAMQLIRYGSDVNLHCATLHGNLMLASHMGEKRLANMLIKAGHANVPWDVIQTFQRKAARWIINVYKSPLSLSDICRIAIRKLPAGRRNFRDFVQSLPIPDMIKKFLMMNELVS